MLARIRPKLSTLLFLLGFLKSLQAEELVVEPKSNSGSTNFQRPQYSSSYANGPSKYFAQSRDSYADAATDLGHGGSVASSGQPMMYHYQVQPMMMGHTDSHSSSYGAPSPSYGEDIEEDEKDGGGSGNIGLLGLLGLKGLKGVKAVKAIKAAAVLAPIVGPLLLPLLPIILPLVLLPLLLPALPLLLLAAIPFLPIPIVTIPVGRAGFTLAETIRTTIDDSLKQDCAERIACEISNAAKMYGNEPAWVTNFIAKASTKSKWMERISKGLKSSECKIYECDIVNSVRKMVKVD